MRKILFAFLILTTTTSVRADIFTFPNDNVKIDVVLNFPNPDKINIYRFTGQSALLHTNGFPNTTKDSPLNGIESSLGTTIDYVRSDFSPNTHYNGFGYFGLIKLIDFNNNILDTSLVLAARPGIGVGQLISDIFPIINGIAAIEPAIVTALDTTFNSPEYLDLINKITSNALTIGNITKPSINQDGDILDLIAFNGTSDVGRKIGTLRVTNFPVISDSVPMPSTSALIAIVAIFFPCRCNVSKRK